MEVRELMTGGPLTVSPDTAVIHARELMARERIRHLPVVDHGALVGIVTDRDIRLCLPSQATSLSVGEMNYQLSRLPVTTIMSAPVVTVGPDDDVADAARLLLNRDIGGLPVMWAGHVLGILTKSDIVRAYARDTSAAALFA